MICLDNSRCKKIDSIEVDNMFICKKCNVIFNKPFKIVINYCKKRFINRRLKFPYCKIVKNLFMYNISSLQKHQPTVTAHVFQQIIPITFIKSNQQITRKTAIKSKLSK